MRLLILVFEFLHLTYFLGILTTGGMLLSVIWKVILHWIRFLKFMITVYGRNWKEVMLSQQRYDHGIPQITLQFGMLKCSLMHSGVCECTSLADADLRAGPYASYCRTADVASKCFQG